ncbi:MAG: recombinase family protein [Bacteroidota bacterium]
MSTPKPVGIWIRVSTEDQARGESPQHHETRARMYAEVRGWMPVRVYDLTGVSGKSVWAHPECQAMLEDVRAGRIEALVFSKLARLARNTRELLDFADHFREHDADLVSLQESIDTSTPAGRLFYTLIAGMAQWEREEIAERVRASVPIRAKLGKPLGGAAPYGYSRVDGRFVLNPDEAPIRKLMFDVFLEERRVKGVVRRLNEMGYRTRRGKKFSSTTVKRLLTEPTAKGKHRVNYSRSLGQKKHWELKPESDWVYVDVPAIVDEETYERVNAIISDRYKPRGKPRTYLFSGLTICRCGQKMYKPKNMKKYYCKACLNKLPETDLELIFVEQLKAFFLDPDAIAAQVQVNDERTAEKQVLLQATHEELASLKAEMDRLLELYMAGGLDPAGFRERNQPKEERARALKDQIPIFQGELDALRMDQLSIAEVVNQSSTLYSRWDTLSFEERRAIVDTVVDEIIVGEREIEIRLAYVPTAKALPLNGLSYSGEAVNNGHHNYKGSSRRRA